MLFERYEVYETTKQYTLYNILARQTFILTFLKLL